MQNARIEQNICLPYTEIYNVTFTSFNYYFSRSFLSPYVRRLPSTNLPENQPHVERSDKNNHDEHDEIIHIFQNHIYYVTYHLY